MADSAMTSLVVDMRPGERLTLSKLVTVELVQKSGRSARLRVVAPREVEIKKESLDACDSRGKHAPITT
jgi:sRNA-binding carbon storage regulator CsrA